MELVYDSPVPYSDSESVLKALQFLDVEQLDRSESLLKSVYCIYRFLSDVLRGLFETVGCTLGQDYPIQLGDDSLPRLLPLFVFASRELFSSFSYGL